MYALVQADILKTLFVIPHYFPSNNVFLDLMKTARTNTETEIVSEIV